MGKYTLLVVGTAAYLMGSRAGREPFEKFSAKADRFMANPRVQDGMDQAKQGVDKAKETVSSKFEDNDSDDSDDSTPSAPYASSTAGGTKADLR